MKAVTLLAAALLITPALSPTPVYGQRGQAARARGLFIKKQADAMRVKVLDNKNQTVDPAREFKAGDEIKIDLESNFEGYVYVVNVEEDGKKCLLFPYAGESNNKIKANESQILPRGATIEFDKRPGIEVLQVIMSRAPIAFLDEALKNPACSDPEKCCEVGGTASNASAELARDSDSNRTDPKKPVRGGIARGNLATVLPESAAGATRARKIILAPGRDRKEGSYVAISDGSKDGTLKPDQVALFEIRLKHR